MWGLLDRWERVRETGGEITSGFDQSTTSIAVTLFSALVLVVRLDGHRRKAWRSATGQSYGIPCFELASRLVSLGLARVFPTVGGA
jgi:hypothetical protein